MREGERAENKEGRLEQYMYLMNDFLQCKASHIHGNYDSQVTSSVYIDTQYTPYYSTTIVSLIHAM